MHPSRMHPSQAPCSSMHTIVFYPTVSPVPVFPHTQVQLKHNKRKSEAIKRLLHADEGGRMGADQLAALGLDDFGDE